MLIETTHRTFFVTDTNETSLWHAKSLEDQEGAKREEMKFIDSDDLVGIQIADGRVVSEGTITEGPLRGYRACPIEGGRFFSLSKGGVHLCAEARSTVLICNRTAIGPWETFRFHDPDRQKKLANVKYGTPYFTNDPEYVDLHEYPDDGDFFEKFENVFSKRLETREESFRIMFKKLVKTEKESPFLVETGCLRTPGNWAGDGQSSFMFDEFTRHRGGTFFSVDASVASVEAARKACSSRANIVLNDSVAFLHSLSALAPRRQIDLLYLDSFDVDWSNPLPSAIHHIKELTACWRLLGPGSLICIDDYDIDRDQAGGKGLIVDDFLGNIRASVIFVDYQKVWMIN